MAAIVWADVTGIAAELATVPVLAQTDLLAYVNTALAVGVFGGETSPKLRLARIYLAAHLATLLTTGGVKSAGPVTSETVGADSISRSYGGSGSDSRSEWELTAYGRQYASLVRTSSARWPRVS